MCESSVRSFSLGFRLKYNIMNSWWPMPRPFHPSLFYDLHKTWWKVSFISFLLCFVDLCLSISLDNDQLDAHLFYFTIRPLQSSTCFEHYMLIIRRMNCIDASSGTVTLSKWPSGAQVEIERSSLSTCAPDGHWLRGRYQMLHQCNSSSWWWACNARNM